LYAYIISGNKVELLKAHFPECFKEMKEVKPLKVGLKQDLVKHLGTHGDIAVDNTSQKESFLIVLLKMNRSVLPRN
jgi:sRNA-binding protein